MKNIAISLSLVLVSFTLTAQDIFDGLRYSTQELSGTARFVGMGGAFGALGNDLSSIKVNPAGSAVFNSNAASFTFDYRRNNVDTQFGNPNLELGEASRSRSRLGMPQVGGVFVFESNDPNTAVQKFTFGINYERTGNFNRNFRAFGTTTESIGDYFVNRANGIAVNNLFINDGESLDGVYRFMGSNFGLEGQEALLGYQGFLISPESGANNETQYNSNIQGSSYGNDMIQRESGIKSVINFNLGFQVNDQLYVGANLNAHVINFDRYTSYFESVNNPQGEVLDLFYENDLRVRGSGFSMQLGAIYVVEGLRLGASLTTPTWYNIEEDLTQGIDVLTENEGNIALFPDVINFFPSYSFRSPGKATASIAYVFGQSGLLSLDYTYQDFANQRFSSGLGLNGQISNTFQSTHNLNIGGEYVYDVWSFRGGYNYTQSPFKDDFFFGDSHGYSLGLGYKFGNNNIDLAYRINNFDRAEQFVQTGIQRSALSENTIHQVMMTYSFLF